MKAKPNSVASIGILSVLGLASALLSILIPALLTAQGSPIFVGSSLGLFPGDIFGAMIALYFAAFAGIRSVTKAISLVVASSLAYLVAMYSGIFFGMFLSEAMGLKFDNDGGGQLGVAMVAPMLIAGVTGAFLVVLAVLRLYSAENSWRRVMKKALLWAWPGGLLALLGWESGPSLGNAIWSALKSHQLITAGQDLQSATLSNALQRHSLHLVWQVGMGTVLGALVSGTRLAPASSSAQVIPERKTNRDKAILFGVMVLAMTAAWYVIPGLPEEYRLTRWHRAYAKHLAEKPSSANLPKIETSSADAMLILTPFGNYFPERASAGPAHVISRPIPQSYSVRYMLSGAPNGGPNVGPHVDTQVQEWPNAAWARWALEDDNFSPALNHLEQPVEFGQRILLQRGREANYYAWPSQNRVVMLEFDSVEPDEFLRKYLEKYPSSL